MPDRQHTTAAASARVEALPTGRPAVDDRRTSQVCDAKIRPFPNDTEVACDRTDGPHDEHRGVLRAYAFLGSETVITWQESDRRTFRGAWRDCDLTANVLSCILPAGHRGDHAR